MAIIKLSALPRKRIFVNKAQKYTADEAIFELLDNSLDRWRKSDRTRPLSVRIRFEDGGGPFSRLIYEDNAGGVTAGELTALVQAGSDNANVDAIGTWGEGLKVAALALSQDYRILTRASGETAWEIVFNAAWWNSETWDIEAHEVPENQLSPGSFRLEATRLRRPLGVSEIFSTGAREDNSLESRIGLAYSPLLSGANEVDFPANVNKVLIRLETPERTHDVAPARFGNPAFFGDFFAFPPGFEPTKHEITLDAKQGLKVTIYAGLLPEQSRDQSGVSMYGKGRLFAFALKSGRVGFGTRGKAKIPASHPTTWRLALLCYFEGHSASIPWQNPAKNGYDENNSFADQLHAHLMSIAEPYAAFTRVAKRLDLLPYSTAWNRLDVEGRKKEVADFPGGEPDAASIWHAHTHLRETFVPPRIKNTTASPKEGPAALSTSAAWASHVARWLRKRQPNEGPWSTSQLQSALMAVEVNAPQFDRPPVPDSTVLDWERLVRRSVGLPERLINVVKPLAGEGLDAWIREACERYASLTEPLFAIPQRELRPLVDHVRSQILARLPDSRGILLFGSVARGEADSSSDIDLVVVHEDPLPAQATLNELFADYREPLRHERVRVHVEALDPGNLRAYREIRPGFRKLVATGIWIQGSEPTEAT